jgi:hypothetical protein
VNEVAAGAVVYDHLALRTGRVERAGPEGVVLVDATGATRWCASGPYRLALEPLDAPNELVLAFELARPAARRAALRALGPVERAVALCRGQRTGACRTVGERVGGELLSEPITARELTRAHEAALGEPGARFADEVLATLERGSAGAPLRRAPAGVRLVLNDASWLLDRLVLDRTWRRERARGGHAGASARAIAALVRDHATSHAPCTPDEELVLAWALGEIVRIERGEALEPVDGQRLGELRSRFWAGFRASVALRIGRRLDPEEGWIDPDTVPEEVFDRLLEHLRGRAGAPAAVERLQQHLAHARGEPPRAPTSQLVRNALYDCLDALRTGRSHTAPRHASFDPLADDGHLRRPTEAAPSPVRELGFNELRALLGEVAPQADPAAQQQRAQQLLRAIRRVFARELEVLRARDPVKYRTVLLDFTSLLSRPRIADYTGINYDTFRWWFPRAGERVTRPPRFVRVFLPDELQGFVSRFGRVFPVLQLGLLPRPHEIDALAHDEPVREALVDLFTFAPLDKRGEFWGDDVLRRAAERTGQTVEAFIDRTLFPFLVALVEHRRARDLDRGQAPWLERAASATAEDAADLELAALALLLLGAPDGRGLGGALRARAEARRDLARAAGLSPLDLVDLELGRRWARPDELDRLRRTLEHDLEGLEPDVAPSLREALALAPEEGT